jgi:hypothetical protein
VAAAAIGIGGERRIFARLSLWRIDDVAAFDGDAVRIERRFGEHSAEPRIEISLRAFRNLRRAREKMRSSKICR